jgi:hypothetical protein
VLWELCCSPRSRLSRAVAEVGIGYRRLTLETGFDFSCPDRAEAARTQAAECHPTWGWCSCPCTAWSAMQNLNQRTKKQRRRLAQARKDSRRLVGNCLIVLLQIVRDGGDIYYEWPQSCQGWSIRELRKFQRDIQALGRTLYFPVVHGCSYGMVDPKGSGKSIHKKWKIATTDASFAQQVARRCPRDHEHKVIQGAKLTAWTAYYPWAMVRRIAALWSASRRGSSRYYSSRRSPQSSSRRSRSRSRDSSTQGVPPRPSSSGSSGGSSSSSRRTSTRRSSSGSSPSRSSSSRRTSTRRSSSGSSPGATSSD